MKHRNVEVSLFVAVLLGSAVISPAQAAVHQRPAVSTYHDAAFSFTYPSHWSSMSPALGQQLKSLFDGFKQQMRVTDVGGVQNGVGAGSVKLHQRISLVLAANAKRLYVVYFIARKSTWSQFVPAFNAAAGSMNLKGAA